MITMEKPVSTEDYTIRIEGLNAGANAGKVIVEGLRTYAGAKKTYYFDINAAVVDDTTVAGIVVYNKGLNWLPNMHRPFL